MAMRWLMPGRISSPRDSRDSRMSLPSTVFWITLQGIKAMRGFLSRRPPGHLSIDRRLSCWRLHPGETALLRVEVEDFYNAALLTSSSATLAVMVDLPTPPFCWITAITDTGVSFAIKPA